MKATEKHKNHDTYFVPGLFRGLRVLEILAAEEKSMTVSEIARALEVSRSSAFRLIYTLQHMGFTSSSDDGRTHQLGARVLNLGFSFLASQNLIHTARDELVALRDKTGISSHLAILEMQDVLFLECVQSTSGFLSNINVGRRVPAYASPLGWLLLTDLSSRELATLYSDVPLNPLTDKTPRDVESIIGAVSKAAATGIVISQGIAADGGCSISAPVFDRSGAVVAAIDISGPESAFDLTKLETKYAPQVLETANSISHRLGYPGGSVR